jgi:hypothetical protein
MAITRPAGEQVIFRSAKTGEHNLDTYMEEVERGGRTLGDMMDDLFDPLTGDFNTGTFQFRYDETTEEIQYRIGASTSAVAQWKTITTFFDIRGLFDSTANPATVYYNFDLVQVQDLVTGGPSAGSNANDLYIVYGLNGYTTGITFADEAAFIASSHTQKLVDVSGTLSGLTFDPRKLFDTDTDTKIEVEASSDDDQIIFTTKGTRRMVITSDGYFEYYTDETDPVTSAVTNVLAFRFPITKPNRNDVLLATDDSGNMAFGGVPKEELEDHVWLGLDIV